MGYNDFWINSFLIKIIDIPYFPWVLLKAHFESRCDPFDCYFVLLLQLSMHFYDTFIKFDGFCFKRADKGRMGIYELNMVRLMQLTVVFWTQDLPVAQPALLLKANGKVLHYLEYILLDAILTLSNITVTKLKLKRRNLIVFLTVIIFITGVYIILSLTFIYALLRIISYHRTP
jgi:hypothetical protein